MVATVCEVVFFECVCRAEIADVQVQFAVLTVWVNIVSSIFVRTVNVIRVGRATVIYDATSAA